MLPSISLEVDVRRTSTKTRAALVFLSNWLFLRISIKFRIQNE